CQGDSRAICSRLLSGGRRAGGACGPTAPRSPAAPPPARLRGALDARPDRLLDATGLTYPAAGVRAALGVPRPPDGGAPAGGGAAGSRRWTQVLAAYGSCPDLAWLGLPAGLAEANRDLIRLCFRLPAGEVALFHVEQQERVEEGGPPD